MADQRGWGMPVNWRRVVIEGGTIVISILLAFAIDAAWEARKDRVEEKEILQALQGDFDAGKTDIAQTLDRHDELMQRFLAFQGMSEAQLRNLSDSEAASIAQAFAAPYTFDPRRGTLDALLGSGKLGLIRDRDLQQLLITFLNQVDDSREDVTYMADSAQRVWLDLVRFGGPWAQSGELQQPGNQFLAAPDGATLLAVRNDAQAIGLVRLHKRSAVRYVSELQRQRATIDTILAALERQLD